MKVLHVITFNAFGGAEKLITFFLPALQQKGIKAGCLILYHERYTNTSATEAQKKLEEGGVEVFIVKYKSMFDREAIAAVGDYIQTGKFDLIHSHLKYADFFVTRLKRKNRISVPIVTTMHGYRDKYQNKFGLQVKSRMFFDPYYWVTRYVCRQFDGVIFISECLRRFYQKAGLPVKKNRIIYHGYTASVKTPVLTEPVETRNHTSPRIGLPGRLIRMKGHRFAIDAIKQLVQNYPGIQLHVFGVGPEEDAIRHHSSETGMEKHVVFHGFVNNLDEKLKEMDVILIPSMGESFGIVFLESFAAGVPVVAFDLPAGNEIIKDGYSGYLAKPGSVEGLVEKLKLILENPEQKNKIITQAYAELKQVFSLDRMTTDYLAFYQEMLEHNN